ERGGQAGALEEFGIRQACPLHTRSDSQLLPAPEPCLMADAYPSVQPLRNVGLISLLASGLFVIRIFSLSHSSYPSNRRARTPSDTHSVKGADTLKFEQAGSPPLQARIQSR